MRNQRTHSHRIGAIIGSIGSILVLGLLLPLNVALAESHGGQAFDELSAAWWQWVFSIHESENPVLDLTGEHCVVGQRGDTWFLTGTFAGAAERTCIIPQGTTLFFPVVNNVFANTPNQCGQGSESYSVEEIRAIIAPVIDAVTTKTVTVDGKSIKTIQRVKSEVFALALAADNIILTVFGLDPCDAGVYSPAVDDGYYVQLSPLSVGSHDVVIHAEGPFTVDVTYHLNVVPVTLE
jgi:hypothetical protein